jgi:uncharacterized membrane-anchored protein
MITEIVTFGIGNGLQRDDVVALYEDSVPGWEAKPELLHKSFLYDQERGIGGGVYLWTSIDAAKTAHGPDFLERIKTVFGSTPEFTYFESPVVINKVGKAQG